MTYTVGDVLDQIEPFHEGFELVGPAGCHSHRADYVRAWLMTLDREAPLPTRPCGCPVLMTQAEEDAAYPWPELVR